MVAAIGALLVKFKSAGFAKVIGQTATFQSKFGKMSKTVKPGLDKMTASFKKFGLVASGALVSLIAASPRLQAEFEILTIRIQQFLRPFGDELAPAIRIVSDLINNLRLIFEGLPEPVQEAITFGGAFVVALGLIAGALTGLALLFTPIGMAIMGLIGIVALLKLAWDENFGGIQDIVQGVFDRIKPIFDSIGGLITGVQTFLEPFKNDFETVFQFIEDAIGANVKNIVEIVNNILDAFKGLIDGIGGLLSGDMDKGITGLQDMFKNAFEAIAGFILLPFTAAATWIGTFLKSDLLADIIIWLGGVGEAIVSTIAGWGTFFFEAGASLISEFIKGAQEKISEAGDVLSNILDWLGGFFGGSLPERGPLRNIQHWGEELGQNYVLAVGTGIESNPGDTNRIMNIQNVNLGFREEQMDTERTFFKVMSEGVRKSTSW